MLQFEIKCWVCVEDYTALFGLLHYLIKFTGTLNPDWKQCFKIKWQRESLPVPLRAYSDEKHDWMWSQRELQPCSELCNTWALLISTFLIEKHAQYTVMEICAHQQYQMCIPREIITLWCGVLRCQRVIIHLKTVCSLSSASEHCCST